MTFDVDKTINYWLGSSAYDLETGKSLLDANKFPYALFFAHLAIEKVLKALVVQHTEEHAPYSHSLPLLAGKTGIEISETVIDQLAEYVEFHLESRYPDERKGFYELCTEDFSRKKFAEMEAVYQWLTERLKK